MRAQNYQQYGIFAIDLVIIYLRELCGGFRLIRNFLRNLMTGRYGPDQLGVAMTIVSLVIYLLYGILSFTPLMFVSYALLILAVFRMMSRNIQRRRSENDKFIRYWWPIKTKAGRLKTELKQRKTHKFYNCPSCHNNLRVPKGKGKLQITCPKCGERFIKKS